MNDTNKVHRSFPLEYLQCIEHATAVTNQVLNLLLPGQELGQQSTAA